MNQPASTIRPGVKLKDAIVLVTGSSRGIGMETVKLLAAEGAHPIVHFNTKAKRAQSLVDEIHAAGQHASLVGGDITEASTIESMVTEVKEKFGKLDVLILNASGGLEMGKDENYPMLMNRDAQINLLNAFLPLMGEGSRVIFVTSHQAHFFEQKPVPYSYEPIAESKLAGEKAVRELLANNGTVSLSVLSADLVEGTIIFTLFNRRNPAAVLNRREQSGGLPTVEEFAAAIVKSIPEDAAQGHTVYIGGKDYFD